MTRWVLYGVSAVSLYFGVGLLISNVFTSTGKAPAAGLLVAYLVAFIVIPAALVLRHANRRRAFVRWALFTLVGNLCLSPLAYAYLSS